MKNLTHTTIRSLAIGALLFGSSMATADDMGFDDIGNGEYFYNDDSWAANEDYAEFDYVNEQLASNDEELEIDFISGSEYVDIEAKPEIVASLRRR